MLEGRRVLGTKRLVSRISIHGMRWDVFTKVRVARHPRYLCMRNYKATFWARRSGTVDWQLLGDLSASEIDKKWVYANGELKGKRIWIEEMLKIPADYQGDIRQHSGNGDLDDRVKTFCFLFNKDGTPKVTLLGDGVELMKASRIHYILGFELQEQFRSTGLSTMALLAYESALRGLEGDLALLEGTMILSPALFSNVAAERRANGAAIKPYSDTCWGLEHNYRNGGYHCVVAYPVGLPSGMLVMAKAISAQLPAADEGMDVDDDKDDPASEANDYRSITTQPTPQVTGLMREIQDLNMIGEPLETFGSFVWYDRKTWHITASTPDRWVDEAQLQERAWQAMLKAERTGFHPHEAVLGAGINGTERPVRGIMGERKHNGKTLYLVVWGDVLRNRSVYRPQPSWESASNLEPEIIENWFEAEKGQVGMRRRVRRALPQEYMDENEDMESDAEDSDLEEEEHNGVEDSGMLRDGESPQDVDMDGSEESDDGIDDSDGDDSMDSDYVD